MKTSASITSEKRTEGQEKQLKRLLEDGASRAHALLLKKLDPDKAGMGRLLANGDEVVDAKVDAILKKAAEFTTSNEFADEEVPSTYGYLSGYKPGVMDLDRQITRFQELFPGLGGANPEYLAKVKSGAVTLEAGAEKFFAVANWKKHPELFGDNYCTALEKVFALIKQTREGGFVNYREKQIVPKRLRQSKRSEARWNKLIEEQGNPDILIISAQFGIAHGGKSVRRARVIFPKREIGLGAVAGCTMLLTHPERLQNTDDLWIDFPGDEFDDPDSGVRFGSAPCAYFGGGFLGFDARGVDVALDRYGSASWFSPQSDPQPLKP